MLECLSLASLASLVSCLWVRPGAYPRVELLKGAYFGEGFRLTANNRLGWEGLPGKTLQLITKIHQFWP